MKKVLDQMGKEENLLENEKDDIGVKAKIMGEELEVMRDN